MTQNHTPKVGRPQKPDTGPLTTIGLYSIFDETEERSLINIVPEEVRIAMLRLASHHEKLFFKDERVFKKEVDPDAITARIRLSFWDEYTRAQDTKTGMRVQNFVRGACSPDYFYKSILPNDYKLAWIVCPPKDYFLAMRDLLEEGIDQLRDIITLPHKDGKKINTSLIAQKIKVIQMLDLRVKGAIVQKLQIDQQTKSLNVNVEQPALGVGEMSLEELQALEEQISKVQRLAAPLLPETNGITETMGRRIQTPKDEAIEVETVDDGNES